MPLIVEGIGGTGKAVINLLKFAEAIADTTDRRPAPFTSSVVDQDPAGIWPNVPCQQPIRPAAVEFATAFGITTPSIQSAASLVFSEAELRTDISQGFYAHPKLAAALRGLWNSPLDKHNDIHVLIYSDIGGTGAGLGPARLKQLLSDTNKSHVVAIVFGKYLNKGTPNTTGHQCLKQYAGLLKDSQALRCRYFTGFYVTVPVSATSGPVPSSGLNPAPALLLAAAYVWRLAHAVRDGLVENLIPTNDRQDSPGRVTSVGFDSPDFVLQHQGGRDEAFIGELRNCALDNNLRGILPPKKPYVNRKFTDFLAEVLPSECWRVFGAPIPQGTPLPNEVNYAGCFLDTFTSVPEPWAAASWFHLAVQHGDPTCQDALRRLVTLYFHGKLHIIRTGWGPDGSEIFALSTRQISPNDANYGHVFARSVVGAFSREFPFWTVPALLPNLVPIPTDSHSVRVVLRIMKRAEAGRIYEPGTDVNESEAVRCAVSFTCPDTVEPSDWQWVLGVEASTWAEFRVAVDRFPLLKANIDLLEGSFQVATKYKCSIRGLQLNKSLLPHDGLFLDGRKGQQFYEVSVTAPNEPIPTTVGRLVIDPANDTSAAQIQTQEAAIIVGNIMARFMR